jgi:hypothetical protein
VWRLLALPVTGSIPLFIFGVTAVARSMPGSTRYAQCDIKTSIPGL